MAQRWFTSQRPDYVVLALAGGVTVVAGAVALVRELAQILPNRDVPVPVALDGVSHELLLSGATGVDGAAGAVAAEATEAVVRVSGLEAVPFALVLAAAVLPLLAMLVVAACFVLLGGSFFRGRFFTRGNLTAVNVAAATLIVTSLLVPSVQGTAASSALVSLGVETGQAFVLGLDLRLLLAGFLLGAVGYAFQRGARLRRDVEGLV
ncbi:hypothetical protein GCM10010413_34610 [Promicromonospora sukumoe]|uniref:DUF2975 family protein n=1 Tax=Promicromonospora sukumoe TaxID=88382 RepID=A0A7W3J6Y6_9MICO|nr:hypothetical protein [Promicromonospora sukumoe]MBA8807406.1 hypothetical protein [Promicromonospora sukumoe]